MAVEPQIVYYGYTGVVAEKLRSLGARPGDRLRVVTKDGYTFEGILMPRYEVEPRQIIVLKLSNGYNIGIRFNEVKAIERLEAKQTLREPGAPAPLAEERVEPPPRRVIIIGTGGTIVSRVDYETGAVKPYMDPEELTASIPELLKHASIDAVELMAILSENMKPSYWARIVEEVARRIEGGYDGIVVTHGTDTMSFTAAAIAFATHKGLPVPIALTGAQRSSDRPSSDAAFNLVSAVIVASKAPFAEVTVVMHGETGDTYALAHRGTRVRKMHTSRRDAFQSINSLPLARIWPSEGRIEVIDRRFRRRGETNLVVENGFDEKVALVYHFPGMISEVIDAIIDRGFHGIVIAGTGFGHVSEDAIGSIKRAVDEGIPVVITSQTLFGRVNLNVYSTGRKMLMAGAIPAEDMLPEVAYVKLSWVLARTRDINTVRSLIRLNLAGEISEGHHVSLYPKWL